MAIVVLPRYMTLHGQRDQSHLNTLQIGGLHETTRSLVRELNGLATGIRPSILAALDLTRYGAPDRLTSNGRAQWDRSISGLLDRAELVRSDVFDRYGDAANRCADVVELDTLTDWLRIERSNERERWHHGESLLRHMQLVFDESPYLGNARIRLRLADQWCAHLAELRYAIHAGTVQLGPLGGRVIESMQSSLAELKQIEKLHDELGQLSSLVDPTGPSVVPLPLLAEDGRLDLLGLLKQP